MVAILDCIGRTPLVRLNRLSRILDAHIFMKLETRNPGGSLWDRLALAYVRGALERGDLSRSGCIVEAADAAFGLSLALVSAQHDVRLILCLPATVGGQSVGLMRELGAQVIVTPAEKGMRGAMDKAAFHHEDTWGSFRPEPLRNQDGPQALYRGAGAEIVTDARMEGLRIDAFVCPVGSGAACTGIGKRLREAFPGIHLMAIRADVPGSSELGGMPSEVFEPDIVAETLHVSAEDAAGSRRRLFAMESINAGLETGAALFGALTLARRPAFRNRNIVCIAGEGRNV